MQKRSRRRSAFAERRHEDRVLARYSRKWALAMDPLITTMDEERAAPSPYLAMRKQSEDEWAEVIRQRQADAAFFSEALRRPRSLLGRLRAVLRGGR